MYTELTTNPSNYRLIATFHGISYVDGTICPQLCSSHGTCSQGKCTCAEGWAGSYCLFKTDKVDLGQDTVVGEGTLAVQTQGLATVNVQVLKANSEFQMAILESPGENYEIPSEDYATYRGNVSEDSGAFSLLLTRSSPLLISVHGKNTQATVRFSAIGGISYAGSSPIDSSKLILIVGISAPAVLVFTILTLLLLCYCRVRHRSSPNTDPSPVLPLAQNKEITLLALNFITTDVKFQDISSHFGDICAVCLETFEKDSRVRQLPCGHVYHAECLVNLACRQQICCVCKQGFERKLDQSMTTLGDFSRIERDLSP